MDLPDLLDSLAQLAWPVIVGFVLWKLLPVVAEIARSRDVRVKMGDMEVSVQNISESLQRDVADLQTKVSELRSGSPAPAATPAPDPQAASAGPRSILWVDDEPENNVLAVARLRAGGVNVRQVRSTSEAMRALADSEDAYGVVVSDMGRSEDGRFNPQAGLDLIRGMRGSGSSIPVVVYTSPGRVTALRPRVLDEGGQAVTGSTLELYELLRSFIPSLF